MSVDEERLKLEQQAEDLNYLLAEYAENPPTTSSANAPKRYSPPHLRKKMAQG